MHVAGIDAHATYFVVAIVGNDGAPSRLQATLGVGRGALVAFRCTHASI